MATTNDLQEQILDIAAKAKDAAASLVAVTSEKKNNALMAIAENLDDKRATIQAANLRDLDVGRKNGLSAAMLDRLELSDKVIDSMISSLHEVVALEDPVGAIEQLALRPNGLQVGRMRVPLGVIGIIYESRPNVTVDAAALCLKTGNSVILRGGSEAIHSNRILSEVIQDALRQVGIAPEAVQVIGVTDREAVQLMLTQEDHIDLIIPRGGEGLIRYVSENSRIPVLKHYKGVCHVYVDKEADTAKAAAIIMNGKTQRPGVCNALEGVLVHAEKAEEFVPAMITELNKAGVEVRGCNKTIALSSQAQPAGENDWGTEFLDLVMIMQVVSNMDEAEQYIRDYGSKHTEVIVTENYTTAQEFIRQVDASAVMVNASTRFNDGGQLGLGTEIGISTTKLHAYGPMGLKELTTQKFVVFGQGQVRA